MKKSITHRFVELIPDHLEDGVLYISTEYATVTHRCFCGCGKEVVTPLSSTDWTLTFDGETVGLYPSVGNWSFPCRSHYWIRGSRVAWCGDMPQELIDAGRARDRKAKDDYYANRDAIGTQVTAPPPPAVGASPSPYRPGLFSQVVDWFTRR